jgi:hypothetical protein
MFCCSYAAYNVRFHNTLYNAAAVFEIYLANTLRLHQRVRGPVLASQNNVLSQCP